MTANYASSFAPVIGAKPRVLILGSMPGQRSLDAQQYYAHPRNAFWPIMAELLGFDPTLGYPERLDQLKRRGIALWDVMAECQRPGSLDSDIVESSIAPNDFSGLLRAQPSIEVIFFNGAKAEQAFNRYVVKTLPAPQHAIARVRLPSTSPAHASMSITQKQTRWTQEIGCFIG